MSYVMESSALQGTLSASNFSQELAASILGSLDRTVLADSSTVIAENTVIAVISSGGEITNVPDTVPVVIFQGASVTFSGAVQGDRLIQATEGDNTIVLQGEGNATVVTGAGDDVVTTDAGGDTVQLGGGNDTVDTGDGVDVVRMSASRDEVTVTVQDDGSLLLQVLGGEAVQQNSSGRVLFNDSPAGSAVNNAELIEFSDGSVLVVAQDNNDGTVARLYEAAFNRQLDVEGFRYWMTEENEGMSLSEMGDRFIDSAEFEAIYGSLSDEAFIDAVYQNVFGRDADDAGQAFWLDKLESGYSKGNLLADFAYSTEAQTIYDDLVVIVGTPPIA